MDADAFRHFYGYHFAENRSLWDTCVMPLSDEQFARPVAYSRGSVRDQILHLMSCDETWFTGLRGLPIPDSLSAAAFPDRPSIRARWDLLESDMRDYLSQLRDDMLATRPLEGEDKDLLVWQVLLHVVNHGTDHRAQLLRVLNDLGLQTTSQDYIFYVYEHP